MTSTKKEDEEKFALIFRAIHDLFKKKEILSLVDKRINNIIRFNDQYKIREQIEIGLKDHVKKIRQQYKLKDQEKFEKSVYTLFNAIKMKIKSDGMMLEMNNPMPYNFHEQSGPNIGDPYEQLPLHHLKAEAAGGDSNEKHMEYIEGSYFFKLIIFFPSDIIDKQSIITSCLNQAYGPGNGKTRGTPSFLFSLYKGEPWTTKRHPFSASNHNSNSLPYEQQQNMQY
ncbi:unnamed protein product [Rotaria socialis]